MKIINFILCDEVRTEDNGKQILIGVYAHNIKLNQVPATLSLTAWLQFMTGDSNEVHIDFRVLDQNHTMKISGGGQVRVEGKTALATLHLPKLFVEFQKPGEMIFQMRESGKRWKTVKTVAVEMSDS